MPDLLSHLLIGSSILLLANTKKKEIWILYLLGNIMIDFERPISLVFKWLGWDWINLTMIFHSFIAVLFLSLSFACFFKDASLYYKDRFTILFLGGSTHLLADLTMHIWSEIGIYLFYPLKIPFSFNLFWPGDLFYPIFAFLLFLSSYLLRKFLNRRKNDSILPIL